MHKEQHTELIISRTFDVLRALVWQARTDRGHIMQWWGPGGFSNSACESDLRIGGGFHLNMCGPDGNSYPCKGSFREIVKPERLVYDSKADDSHSCGAGLPPRSRVAITFTEQDNKTTFILHTRFESVACKDAANQAGYSISWGQVLARLGDHLH